LDADRLEREWRSAGLGGHTDGKYKNERPEDQ
jgi:hypothetical protein